MDRIRKYIKRFRFSNGINENYDMKATEWLALRNEVEAGKATEAISDAFTFGYAKGYRAAVAEMQKGGSAV